MAIHHPTPPLGGGERPRLPSAQVGPVTQAVRAMRFDNAPDGGAADDAIEAIRDGLTRFFAETNAVKSGIAALGKPRDFRFQDHGTRAMPATESVPHTGYASQFTHGIRALSRTEVENLVEGLIDLLDAWDGDADCEATALERSGRGFRSSGYDDAEDGHDAEANTDDNGIADFHALGEQGFPGYGGCL